jgi:hypothetical protein
MTQKVPRARDRRDQPVVGMGAAPPREMVVGAEAAARVGVGRWVAVVGRLGPAGGRHGRGHRRGRGVELAADQEGVKRLSGDIECPFKAPLKRPARPRLAKSAAAIYTVKYCKLVCHATRD